MSPHFPRPSLWGGMPGMFSPRGSWLTANSRVMPETVCAWDVPLPSGGSCSVCPALCAACET